MFHLPRLEARTFVTPDAYTIFVSGLPRRLSEEKHVHYEAHGRCLYAIFIHVDGISWLFEAMFNSIVHLFSSISY